ncbi:hypothetical protein L7F22_010447 [Adiantum nelumboides]|nr:hypothetical protein [Adiantum nelumboides]
MFSDDDMEAMDPPNTEEEEDIEEEQQKGTSHGSRGNLQGRKYIPLQRGCEKINGRLGPAFVLDQEWVDSADRRAAQRLERLENELSGYKTNLIKESIRMGHNDLGDFHYGVAEQTPDNREPQVVAKLRVAAGLAFLENQKYKHAARKFVETSSDLGVSYTEVIAPQDVATYGGLCALASFDRAELKSKVIDNINFKNFLELVPEVRELIHDFYASQLGFKIEPNIEVKVVEQPRILTKEPGHDQQVARDVNTFRKEMQEVVGLMKNLSVHMMRGGRGQGYGYGRGYGSNEGFAGGRGRGMAGRGDMFQCYNCGEAGPSGLTAEEKGKTKVVNIIRLDKGKDDINAMVMSVGKRTTRNQETSDAGLSHKRGKQAETGEARFKTDSKPAVKNPGGRQFSAKGNVTSRLTVPPFKKKPFVGSKPFAGNRPFNSGNMPNAENQQFRTPPFSGHRQGFKRHFTGKTTEERKALRDAKKCYIMKN